MYVSPFESPLLVAKFSKECQAQEVRRMDEKVKITVLALVARERGFHESVAESPARLAGAGDARGAAGSSSMEASSGGSISAWQVAATVLSGEGKRRKISARNAVSLWRRKPSKLIVPERIIVTAARGGKGAIVSLGIARGRSSSGSIIGALFPQN